MKLALKKLRGVVEACERFQAQLYSAMNNPLSMAPDVVRIEPRSAGATGWARHPLVVSRQGPSIQVWLTRDGVSEQDPVVPPGEWTQSLLAALSVVQAEPSAARLTRDTVTNARALAFNTDRFAAALTLAAKERVVEVDCGRNVLALALAVAVSDTPVSYTHLTLPTKA